MRSRSASALYAGEVTHRRFFPTDHRLRYGVWYALLDLDELPILDRRVRWFGSERPAPVSFRAEDHGPRDGSPLRPWIEQRCAEAGVPLEGGAVRILCFPRILGYVFNPIAIWFCHGPAGDLRAICYEVSNTSGGWHHYLLPVDPGTGLRADGSQVVRSAFAKELFVSPFIDMASTYDFRTRVPDDRLQVTVRQSAPGGHVLTATLTGRRLPFTSRSLTRVLLRYPLVTLKATAGIHWEAFKLWRKGAPYRRRGLPPVHDLTVLATARDASVSAPEVAGTEPATRENLPA
jgi:DUF1365 family protein